MLKLRILFFLVLFWLKLIHIQNNILAQDQSLNDERYKVYADSRIDSFRAFLPIAQLSTFYKKGYPAYRIQVVSTNKKQIAQKVLSDLPIIAPDHKIHFTYREPYYRVRIGAFKTEKDAEPLRLKIDLYYKHKFVVVTLPENIPYKECLAVFTLPHNKYNNLMIPPPEYNLSIDTLFIQDEQF